MRQHLPDSLWAAASGKRGICPRLAFPWKHAGRLASVIRTAWSERPASRLLHARGNYGPMPRAAAISSRSLALIPAFLPWSAQRSGQRYPAVAEMLLPALDLIPKLLLKVIPVT